MPPNGLELSGAARLLHPILALRLRPLQRVVGPPGYIGGQTGQHISEKLGETPAMEPYSVANGIGPLGVSLKTPLLNSSRMSRFGPCGRRAPQGVRLH
jgi:hypothetical protein